MKRKWIIDIIVAVTAVTALAVWLVGFPPTADIPVAAPEADEPVATDPSEPELPYTPEPLSFDGKVLEVDGDSVLMECYLKTRFDTVWVNIGGLDVTPQVGEEYTVYHEDMTMTSLPPRITAVKIERASSEPASSEAKVSFISEQKALEIASDHWGIRSGDRDPDTGFMMSISIPVLPTEESPHYEVTLRWYVENEEGQVMNASLLDFIYIDAVTGEIIEPATM